LADASRIDIAALKEAGVPATQSFSSGELDLIVGLDAPGLAGAINPAEYSHA
jgi:PTS system glucose-specific IIC component